VILRYDSYDFPYRDPKMTSGGGQHCHHLCERTRLRGEQTRAAAGPPLLVARRHID